MTTVFTISHVVLFVGLLAGCVSQPVVTQSQTGGEQLAYAYMLLESDQPSEAIPEFLSIRDTSLDPIIRKKAMLGCAASFAKRNDFKSALNVLNPYPPVVLVEQDAIIFAMVGELYLRLGAPQTAASYIEKSLYDNPFTDNTHWRAAAMFNYGKCALALSAKGKAQEIFQDAVQMYDALDDVSAHAQCETVLKTLEIIHSK